MSSQEKIRRLRAPDAIKFEHEIELIQDTWLLYKPTYQADPGTERAYDEMADAVIGRLRQITASEWANTSSAAQGGIHVMARHIYAGAAKAAEQDNVTPESLVTSLLTRPSFEDLSHLTRERNSAALQIESENGLRRSAYSSVDYSLDKFSFDPTTGLKMKQFPIQRLIARDRLLTQGTIDEDEAYGYLQGPERIRCPAHAMGITAVAYEALLSIAAEDEDLFAATLAR